MTSYFPHTTYAEDQPNAHAILYLHVARAAAMSGSFLSLFSATASLLVSKYRRPTPITMPTLASRLLTHSGRGLLIGSVLGVAMTYGRMFGKEEIEWQDRAWRLQENKGEEDTDVVTFEAAAAGAVLAGLAASRGRLGAISATGGAVGGAGLGMASGVGYMISTYVRGRKPA